MTLFTLDSFAIDLQPYDYKIDKLFHKKCSGCHGTNGQKKALGRSYIINQMDKERLLKSMQGYQNGTYGGVLKGLMRGRLRDLSSKQIDLLATYIAAMSSHKRVFPPIKNSIQSKETIKQPTSTSTTSTYTVPVNSTQSKQTIKQPACVTPAISTYRAPVNSKQPVSSYKAPVPLRMKMKSKRFTNGIVSIKAMIKHKMIREEMAKKRGVKPTHIERIRIKEDDHLLIEMKTTAYLSKNPIFKMRYKSFGGRWLRIDAKDSEAQTNEGSVRIRDVSGSREIPEVEIDREKRTEFKIGRRFISAYFSGATLTESDEIMLKVPDVASNGGAVPVGIRSPIRAKSVTLFATEEDDRVKMVCQWVLHDSKIIDFDIKIKLRNMYERADGTWPSSGVISVVVEGEDEKHYIVEKDVSVALAGGN